MKHTPGPWECFYKSKYDEWHVSIPLEKSEMRMTLFNNGVPKSLDGTDCREANARLIAKAPEMLELLKRWINISAPKSFWTTLTFDTEKLLKELEQ